ncbi:MAG TPA: LysM peptidoglycan-binding domain-containing protein [Thermoanaerobaculia bacterium]|nr:LysM peptidoglycan-binding domain-containing protein [Thermoanaerobaculia bacterium]
MFFRMRSLVCGLLLLPLLPTVARAQEAPPFTVPEGFEAGWHIVRPGDTLEGIAGRYMGSSAFWRQLHRLNQGIVDPDRIEPGQRIRILVKKSGPAAAQIEHLSRQVEEQPSPIPWSEARLGDVLLEKDALRTFRKSSAGMRFTDGARLKVTEDSLVFLRRTGDSLRGEKRSVEIVEGQADLEARPALPRAARVPDVEIVLGGTRATSRPDASGAVQARARKPTEGGAKVMVYGGEGEVEAGGARVQVPQGMGTSVAEQGPPSPPEKLLPAPGAVVPEPGASLACSNPLFSWEAVPEAASYLVEICRDPACNELVERATGLDKPEWQVAALPVGTYHWRATARSRSGLDGYPRETAALQITSEQPAGTEAPAAALRLEGTRIDVAGKLFVAPGARLSVTAADGSAVTGARPVLDGQESAGWPASWTPGEHKAGAVGVDGCGRRNALVAPVAFVVDAEPPAFEAEAGTLEAVTDRMVEPRRESRRVKRERKSAKPVPADLLWSSGWEDRWEPLADTVEIRSDRPQLFFRAPEGTRFEGNEGGGGAALFVTAGDGGSGLELVRFRMREEGGGKVLEVEAVDLVGNVGRREWRVVK